MKGIFIACPNPQCKKPLVTEAQLPPRTSFKLLCAYCSTRVKIETDIGKLRIIIIHMPVQNVPLTDDDEDDIVILNV